MLIAILKWLALLPVVLLGKLATILCAPVAAYLSMPNFRSLGNVL